jgi:molybdate transport system substrate-binding protein
MKTLCAFVLSLLFSAAACAEQIHVSVAVSLREAATDIAREYKAATGDEIVLTFGSSGQLATQIKDGADVDAFISAANKQVDDLVKAGLADSASRRVVASNTLVLIVPAGEKDAPAAMADLADARFNKIAIGDPKTVPAGDYAMQTLTSLKLADKVAPRLVFGTNVRQVLAYVEGGNVAAGLVYSTDARESGDKVKVVATAADKDHQPIVYPAVVLSGSKKKDAALKFLDHLRTEKARNILQDKGFTAAESAAAPAKAPAP